MSNLDVCTFAYEGKGAEMKKLLMPSDHSGNSTGNDVISAKDVNVADNVKRTPLHWAAVGGRTELASFLLDHGARVDSEDDYDWTPLLLASSAGHVNLVKLLIGRNANVNAKNQNGCTSLHYAASKDHLDVAKILMENGSDVNARENYGATPLHRAASKGNVRLVEILLADRKCNVDVTDGEGNTPLHLACMENRQDPAILLLKHGARLDVMNKQEQSPLDVAEPGLRRTLQRMSEQG